MQVLPSQGTMPPFHHNLLKLVPKAQTSKSLSSCSSGRSSQRRQSSNVLPRATVLTAAETITRCFATPSIHGPVWPYGVQHGTLFMEIGEAADRGHATSATTGCAKFRSCFVVGVNSLKNNHGRRKSDNSNDWKRRGLTNFSSVQHYFAFHFYQTPWADGPNPIDLFARSLHAARESQGATAQPGLVSCGRTDEESTSQVEAEEDRTTTKSGVLKFTSGACCLPHPDKVKKGGEDAHFICTDISAVGVADGVGGWADIGVDAGLYARELMAESAKALAEEPEGWSKPRSALKKAHSLTKSPGSSTACLIVLSDDRLHAANLGDSGFVVIRNGRTVFKSPPQQHDFNFPYQLGSQGCDPPDLAEEFAFPVAAGDILVVGTDGLFDNLFDSELASVVMHSFKAGWGPEGTAERVATLAHLRAQDPLRQSPFARAAQEAGYRFMGGKMDDITVVVSYVTHKDKKEESS